MIYRYTPLIPSNVTAALQRYMEASTAHGVDGQPIDLLSGPDDGNCSHGVQWIFNVFGDCVDTNVKLLGFVVGLVSICLWLLPVIPQLYENYKRKRCEGISVFFLMFWIFGDMCNFIGALLTGQQSFQKLIAVYYVCQDVVFWGQFIYYNYRLNRIPADGIMGGSVIVVPTVALGIIGGSMLVGNGPPTGALEASVGGRVLLAEHALTKPIIFTSNTDLVGYIIGTLASFCYFAGRIPQIRKNYYEKSCEGLSITMFIIIIAGNLTYGFSVLLESSGWIYMIRHLPWLLGSLGCVFFDVIIVSQYYRYKRQRADRVPLITDADDD